MYYKKEKSFAMLETLSAVPWSELQHAYGTASDVPELIRALASPEQKVHEDALVYLYSRVLHQGSVYSSTPYVVPFLCELLAVPEVQNKVGLLNYLRATAESATAHASYYIDDS